VGFSSAARVLAVVLPCDPLSSASRLAVAPSGTSLNDSRIYLALFQSTLFAHTHGHSKAHNLTATRGLVAKGIAICNSVLTAAHTRAACVRLDWRRYCHAHSGLRCTQSSDVIIEPLSINASCCWYQACPSWSQHSADMPPTAHVRVLLQASVDFFC
jgi:hypothetical protein